VIPQKSMSLMTLDEHSSISHVGMVGDGGFKVLKMDEVSSLPSVVCV